MIIRRRHLPPALPLLPILLCAGLGILVEGQQPQAETPRFRAGELIVKFRPDTRGTERDTRLAAVGARSRRRFRALDIEHITLPERISIDAAMRMLARDSAVVAVQPNFERHIVASAPPNDPFWVNDSLWGLRKINIAPVWTNYGTGDGSVVVADIDTGVNYTHPDLAANMWRNPGEVAANGVDDDGNGFVDDIHGVDTANNDSDPMDDNGHGTHSAGTIAGVGNNGIGVTGINWNAKILACKFLDASGIGYDADAIRCFDYLVDLRTRGVNIRVSNNSWGDRRRAGFPTAMKAAIEGAGAAGILNVFAAGNEGVNSDVTPFDPASLTSASIVSVAASTQSDDRASFSNYGATSVDLAAPGVSIVSTWGGSYAATNGTSMAAPHVSGVAALLLSVQPTMTIEAVKMLMLEHVDRTGPWAGVVASGGRLDAQLLFLNGYGTAAGASQTLLTTEVPAGHFNDGVPYELGVRVRSDVAGEFTAIRYWKSPMESGPGPHVGRIWAASGQLLATVTFTSETASGWQQQALTTPVPVAANTDYVVSVNTQNYFADTQYAFVSGLLHGHLQAVAGANGLYGPPGTFPTGSYASSNYFRDVVFAPAGSVPNTTPAVSQTLLTTEVPAGHFNDGVAYELGVRVRAAVAGEFTAIRYWKSPMESGPGPHVGRIWAASGQLLATVTFTGETASGWQQQVLATPLSVAANMDYIVSVNTQNFFADTQYAFVNGLVHGHLQAVAGANGLYGPPGSFPTGSYASSNYFRDVVFVPGSGPPDAPPSNASQTLLTTEVPAGHFNDGVPYELGVRLRSDVAGQFTAIRFWKSPTESGPGPHVGRIWTATGVLLASVMFAAETASGWQQQALSTPVTVTANTEYVVSVNTQNYFADTQYAFVSGLLHGHLQAVAGANGLYGPPGSFPTGSYASSNYFRDVVFVPTTGSTITDAQRR